MIIIFVDRSDGTGSDDQERESDKDRGLDEVRNQEDAGARDLVEPGVGG